MWTSLKWWTYPSVLKASLVLNSHIYNKEFLRGSEAAKSSQNEIILYTGTFKTSLQEQSAYLSSAEI